MVRRTIGKVKLAAGTMLVGVVPALSGCAGHGSENLEPPLAGLASLQAREGPSPISGNGVFSTVAAPGPAAPFGPDDPSPESGGSASTDATASPHRRAPGADSPRGQPDTTAVTDTPGTGAADRIDTTPGGATTRRTQPGDLGQAERPRENPGAVDLLDHWGHRRVRSVVAGLSLGTAGPAAGGADPKRLRAAAQAREGTSLAPSLHAGDEVRLLGSRHGVTYGRWTGGPADTLSIEFDLSRAGSAMRGDPAFRALLERSAKAWSRRIADTWASWDRAPGEYKGALWNDGTIEACVWVGADGETSESLEIDVKDNELAEAAGRGGPSGREAPGRAWERRFGTVEIDREFLGDAGEASLFRVLAHEIGHVLGAWWGDPEWERSAPYADEATGTWTGPNVVAVHGRPAPFQDDADPYAWVNGERSSLASEFDFLHSGVCRSLMAYCNRNDPRPALLPHAIDFAFLADLGMTVTDETSRPETYGLVGWTDDAAFSLSVSRDLQLASRLNALDFTDLLRVEVDVFGLRSAGDLRQSHAAEGLSGTVRYAGGLLGAAIDRPGLPPVTGDSSLALDLGTLDGTASFTSLEVHARGTSGTFSGGSLHYPFEVSANGISGTGTGSTLRADFYGPGHESVAGALHNPGAGLLASFGAAHDDRPGREDVVAAADLVLGGVYRSGAADPAADGWTRYRCATASACESRGAESDGSRARASASRSEALAATAGWTWRTAEKPEADRGFVRIARHSHASTDGLRGRHVVDGYTGTLEHVAFGTGFERHTNWSLLSRDGIAETVSSFSKWSGAQGTASGAPPDESVGWSGFMLGYQSGHPSGQTPFVEGLASLEYSLGDHSLDVAFSDVASRDGRRALRDFAFEGLEVEEDGTFGTDGAPGTLDGAFFGPSEEEAAGAFHHNASRITGGFGARRLPGVAALEESDPSKTRTPIVDVDETRYVGADAAPAPDSLAPAGDYAGVAVSSGGVRDGAGAERILAFLERHIDEDSKYWIGEPGLATFADPPVVRLATGASEALVASTEDAVRLINSALPRDRHIVFGTDPAPRLAAIGDVPDGEIFIDFAPSVDDWNHGWNVDFSPTRLMMVEIDPLSEHNASAKRREHKGMRAAHVWFNNRVISNAAWIRNPVADTWEYQVLSAPVIESDTVRRVYTGETMVSRIARQLLRTLGFVGSIDPSEFPDSLVHDGAVPRTGHLPSIDGEALLAAYARLEPGTQPEDLSVESLGPWDDTSLHLRGDLEFAGGRAAFGVALRNGLVRPWASGPAPLAALENNSALFGTVSWNGALLGLTPSAETVAGRARLAVELSTLDGQLEFTGLERWGEMAAPGEAGSATRWGAGDLEYAVEVRGNSFHRTGGDDGEVAGAFFGAAHEVMGGVLERSDVTAGFGGTR